MSTDRKFWIGVFAGGVAVIIWAGWISATRFAVSDAGTQTDPLVLAICRAGLPAVILAPVIWRRGLFPSGAPMVPVLVMAAGWGAPFVFFVGEGLKTVPASLFGPLVPGLAPILVALFAWAILAERPGPRIVWGLAMIGGAMAAVLGQWASQGDWPALAGAPWLIAASAGISLYTVMFRMSGLSPIEGVAYISLYSLPMLLAWFLAVPGAVNGLSWGAWGFHALTQGVLTGILAVLAYGTAVRHLGTVRGATANAMVPVTAALVGGWFLDEVLTMLEWVAVITASLGVAVVNGVRIGRLFSR